MSDASEPLKSEVTPEVLPPTVPPPNAGRSGYNDSPNHTATAPNFTVSSIDRSTTDSRGDDNVTRSPGSNEHRPSIPYPPPNTHYEQPEHPTFGGRGGYNTSPQFQAPVPAFAKDRPSTLEQEHGGFGGRGGYNAGGGFTPAPEAARNPPSVPEVVISPHTTLHRTQTFADYEAEHKHGAGSRKGSVQNGPDHGFGGRGGYNASTAGPTSTGPAPPFGSPHSVASYSGHVKDHGHDIQSPKGSVQVASEHGFGGRGGYNAGVNPAVSPPGPFNPPDRGQTFAEYEAQHGHDLRARSASLQDAPEHGFGGRGGYNASVSGKASPSPGSPFGAPHRAQTFAEYEAEHVHAPLSRNTSIQEGPEHGFGGRGGYNANINPGSALTPEGPFATPHRTQSFAEYEAEHSRASTSRRASAQENPDHGFGGRGGYNATANPNGALSPEAPFSAPRRAQTFQEYEAEHALTSSMRKATLQEPPEHGFGGRGGYNANVTGGGLSHDAPFGAPHRAQTFSDYEKELERGTEVRKTSVSGSVHEHDAGSRRHSRLREERERPGFGGRGGYNERPMEVEGREHEHGMLEQDIPGHPGYGGRGGYNGQR
ncbi:hypothetical protein MMC13_001582 [Lambiella insularis]|nr:hypothetical protein [Lambiella insularis]